MWWLRSQEMVQVIAHRSHPQLDRGAPVQALSLLGAPALGAEIRRRFIARYTRSTTWSQFGSENNNFENQFSLVKTQFVKYKIKLAC